MMTIKRSIVFACILMAMSAVGKSNAPTSAEDSTLNTIRWNGYVDVYYAHYTDSVPQSQSAFQKFPTVSPRSNSFGLNAAVLTADYVASDYRATLGLHYGDISQSSWSTTFPSILEAHAGVQLTDELWFDAGFFRTHFGTEALYPKENFCSSIAVPTFYEPYFECGARLQYVPNDDVSVSLFVLNGYNVFEDNNKAKSVGVLATYALSKKTSLGYSNYIGDDSPDADTVSHLRVHNNLFFNGEFDRLKIQCGIDFCMQGHSSLKTDTVLVKLNDSTFVSVPNRASKTTASMFSFLLSAKFQIMKKSLLYARFEALQDPEGFMTTIFTQSNGAQSGYKMIGFTIGAEYAPTAKSYFRLEGRRLSMDDQQKIFLTDGMATSSRTEIQLNFGLSF